MEDQVIFLQRSDTPNDIRCWIWCSGESFASNLKFARKRCKELNRGLQNKPWEVISFSKSL